MGVNVADSSVLEPSLVDVLVALGSNIEKERNLPLAIEMLQRHAEIAVTKVSSVYEAPAIDRHGEVAEQSSFHNAAVWLETALTPQALKQELRRIEEKLGRIRAKDKFAPRPIDLDIAFYGELVMADDELEIPDADVEHLPHLALPLSEIAPGWIHPNAKRSLRQIAKALTAAGKANDILRLYAPKCT